ncbi:MFS transporter [Klebsiella pneumoniae]|uniref:MFS transporter n=1 Tax=Klebsiella pneumoniae TaxID=573 RepID=UPI0038B81DCE
MSAINEKAVNGTQLQRTHKKIYRHLMPLLIVAYIISFIDRTNIGMAKATMSVDIGLSATAFGLGAGLFFLTYAVLEIPSNLFLTRIGARRWIARIMITWGILSCGMAFVTGPTSYFLPGIIGSWGQLTPLQVGLLTAIPWIAAAAGGILLPRFARTEQRSRSMLMAGYLVMATGMAIGAIAGHGVALLGFSLAAFMFFAMQSIIFNWLPSIMSGHMLAGSFGLLNCLGLCGGFLGPFILGAFEDRTGAATSGLWFAVALLIIGALVSLFLKSSSSPGSVSAKQAHGEKV